MFSPLIDQVIAKLKILPGVGPKSAQRMALHLLEKNREGALELAHTLAQAVDKVKRCSSCRTLTEQDQCSICVNPKRDHRIICVVETPADIFAIEQSSIYSGRYFVLHGHLSPIDGIGPRELGLDDFDRAIEGVEEVILATNPTMEGEATAHYLAEKARAASVRVTRIAHGVPIGGELEYIDGGTLAHALNSRRELT